MKALAICSILIFLGVASGYMNAYLGLLRIIRNEKPDWLRARGSLDAFYQGLPQAGNPNVVAQVICVAFSRRAQDLVDEEASSLARRVRYLLPILVLVFLVFLLCLWWPSIG